MLSWTITKENSTLTHAKTWSTIKQLIGKQTKSAINTEFELNGDITNDNQLIANSFNNYFVEIGSTLAKDITPKYDPLKHIKIYTVDHQRWTRAHHYVS